MPRKQKTIHYIYKTTCTITKRYYIGMHSTNNLEDGYLGSGKRLRYSIRKYGKENHVREILEFCDTRELLIEAEKKIVTSKLIQDDKCMNLMCGGMGGFISKEHIKNLSKYGNIARTYKMKNDDDFRKKISDNARSTMKQLHKDGKINPKRFTGKNHTQATKKLISNLRKGTGIGETNSQYGTCWITKDGLNKKIKKETLVEWVNDGWIKGRK